MDNCIKRDIVWISETDEEVAPSTLALYQASDQQEARLDWQKLPPDNAYELYSGMEPTGPSFTLYLVDQIKNVEEISGEKHVPSLYPTKFILKLILIDETRRPVVLCFQEKENLKNWNEALKTALEAGRKHRKKVEQKHRDTLKKGKSNNDDIYSASNPFENLPFNIDVDSTAASIRNNVVGSGTLLFSRNHITLYNTDKSYSISWHYNHIRRFGYTSTTFTLEGGKKSGVKGNGLFIFRSCPGHKIRQCIENNVKLLTQRNLNADSSNSEGSDMGDYEMRFEEKLYAQASNVSKIGQTFEKTPAEHIEFYATAADISQETMGGRPFMEGKPSHEQPPKVPPKKFNLNSTAKPQSKTPDIVSDNATPKMSKVVQTLSNKISGYEETSTYSALSFDQSGQVCNNREIPNPSGNLYGEALFQQKDFRIEEQAYYEVDYKAGKKK